VRFFLGFLALAVTWAWQAPPPAAVNVQEHTHFSQVMNANRTYRVFLPASYAASQKRYPVVYWFHGYENSAEVNAYSKDISDYLAAHDLIVVDSGPLETTGQFPMYFQELMDQVDHTLRTVSDREHRGVSGFSAGGFLAFLVAD
jgi:enterochelin esterase-like enzyme